MAVNMYDGNDLGGFHVYGSMTVDIRGLVLVLLNRNMSGLDTRLYLLLLISIFLTKIDNTCM